MTLGVIKTLAREAGRSWLASVKPRNTRFEISFSAFLLLVLFIFFFNFLKPLFSFGPCPSEVRPCSSLAQRGEMNACALSALLWKMGAELLNKILPLLEQKNKKEKEKKKEKEGEKRRTGVP